MTTDKPNKRFPRFLRGLLSLASFCLGLADFQSKKLLKPIIQSGGDIELTPFLNLTSGYNTGVAFGFLNNAGEIAKNSVIIFSFVFCALAYAFLQLYRNLTWFQALIAVLLLAGGAANLVDRLIYGAVFDFIDFHVAGWHWPAFNFADIYISVAILLMLIESLRPEKKLQK